MSALFGFVYPLVWIVCTLSVAAVCVVYVYMILMLLIHPILWCIHANMLRVYTAYDLVYTLLGLVCTFHLVYTPKNQV